MDDNGYWHYFYWGGDENKNVWEPAKGTDAEHYEEIIAGPDADMSSTEAIKEAIKKPVKKLQRELTK